MAIQRSNLESSALFAIYTSVPVDRDLRISYPGWVQGMPPKLPRLVLYTGGVLVVQLQQGSNVVLPGAFANFAHANAPAKLISAGTTATAIKVDW